MENFMTQDWWQALIVWSIVAASIIYLFKKAKNSIDNL